MSVGSSRRASLAVADRTAWKTSLNLIWKTVIRERSPTLRFPQASRAILAAFLRVRGRRRKSASLRMRKLRRALVIRPDLIGDAILTTPLLRELARNWPELEIHVATRTANFNLLETCPHLQSLIAFDCRSRGSSAVARAALALWRSELWDLAPDLVLLPRWSTDLHLATPLGFATGGWVVGHSHADRQTAGPSISDRYDCFLDLQLSTPDASHHVEGNLSVIEALGGEVDATTTQLWLTNLDRERARHLLNRAGPRGSRPRVALAPGASHPNRRWPVERLAALGQWLCSERHTDIVIVGSEEDREDGERLVRELPAGAVIDTCGRTTLRESAAVLEACRLLVGMDSAPSHLAAAVRTPVVMIAHRRVALPYRFSPWIEPHRLVRPPPRSADPDPRCAHPDRHGIERVSVEAVKDAVGALFEAPERLGGARGVAPSRAEAQEVPLARSCGGDLESQG